MATNVVHSFVCLVVFFSIVVLIPTSSGHFPRCFKNPSGQLAPDYYRSTCPQVFEIVRKLVKNAINCDPRMGASLLRLHFHDCWVNGCDGSVLLVDIGHFVGEQSAIPNKNSLRGFDVVAQIKSALNSRCGNVVSCADILAIAARDSVNILGGPCYQVLLGRTDSITANQTAVNINLPSPFANITTLIANFASHGFGLNELVAMSGGHTIGLARCGTFRKRLYNDEDIDPGFANSFATLCPNNNSIGGNNTAPFDNTTTVFDTVYFKMLKQKMGLLHSDQELYSGNNSHTAQQVTRYSRNALGFLNDFAFAMIKMGNLLPLPNSIGEIRCNCSVVNDPTPANNNATVICPSPAKNNPTINCRATLTPPMFPCWNNCMP